MRLLIYLFGFLAVIAHVQAGEWVNIGIVSNTVPGHICDIVVSSGGHNDIDCPETNPEITASGVISATGISVTGAISTTSLFVNGTEITGGSGGGSINFEDFAEQSPDPANPAADTMRVFARDDGSGNTELVAVDSAGNEYKLNSPPGEQSGGEKSTTSGSSVSWTGLPDDVKKIIISFRNVSLNGSNNMLIQIGDSSGFETSGYSSYSKYDGGSAVSSINGFVIRTGSSPISLVGHAIILKIGSNEWSFSHMSNLNGSSFTNGAGVKTLSGTLDRVRILPDGSNFFDQGSAGILY